MANYSLLRYPGGKTRAVPELMKYVPQGTKEIVSPFFGGGSFEIALAKKGIAVNGFDSFDPVVHFWLSVMYDKEKLIKIIEEWFPLSKASFYALQKSFPLLSDSTTIGAIYFILNRASFSGTGLSGGMSPNHPRFNQASIDRIKNFNVKFSIQLRSFEDSLLYGNSLVYADPPYMIEQKLYGTRGSHHEGFNHEKLAQILNDRENFILSYNNHPKILEMYKGHRIEYPSWAYGMGGNKRSNEVLIISADLAAKMQFRV